MLVRFFLLTLITIVVCSSVTATDLPSIRIPPIDIPQQGDLPQGIDRERLVSLVQGEIQRVITEANNWLGQQNLTPPDYQQYVDAISTQLEGQAASLEAAVKRELNRVYVVQKEKFISEVDDRVRSEIDTVLVKKINEAVDSSGLPLRKPSKFQVSPFPKAMNMQYNSVYRAFDENGTEYRLSERFNANSTDFAHSSSRNFEGERRLEIATQNGLKVVVFDRKSRYYLRNVIKTKTTFNGTATVDAHAEFSGNASHREQYEVDPSIASDLLDDALGRLKDQFPNHSGAIGNAGSTANNTINDAANEINPIVTEGNVDANGQVDLLGQANVNGEINGLGVVDVNMFQDERGVVVALPVVTTSKGSRLVFETGIKERVDVLVVSLVAARVHGRATVSTGDVDINASGQTNVNANVTAGGHEVASYANAFPFEYSGAHNPGVSHTLSHSVDGVQTLQNQGIRTTAGSKQTYLVVPIGIGFYSANGSKIRLLVDLKPERLNKKLHFRAPQSESDLNNLVTNAIAGAELEAEGRANFDSFTILAGLNASFRTFEVNLQEFTGNETVTSVPVHAHVQVYTGFETRKTSVRLIAEAEAKMLEGHAGGYLQVKRRLDNGWSFGVMTGYEKHVIYTGVPEMTHRGNINGTETHDFSDTGSNSYGTYGYNGNAVANYDVNHSTVVNAGERGYKTYSAVPLDLVVEKSLANGGTAYGNGNVVFVDDESKNDWQFERVGLGGGYVSPVKRHGFIKAWNVGAEAFYSEGNIHNQGSDYGGAIYGGFQF